MASILTDVDRDALDRCMKLYAAIDAEHAQDLNEKKRFGATWRELAEYACYHFQIANLALRPWQNAPLHLVGESKIRPEDMVVFKVLQKMQQAGLSIYEPDPLAAVAAVNRKGGDAKFSRKARTRR